MRLMFLLERDRLLLQVAPFWDERCVVEWGDDCLDFEQESVVNAPGQTEVFLVQLCAYLPVDGTGQAGHEA